MSDRPALPSGPGRIAATEDQVVALAARVFTLERANTTLAATIAALTARIATLEATP